MRTLLHSTLCLVLLALTPRAEAGTTAAPPTITSPSKASITATTATLGGNITSSGSVALATRGIVYALTSVNPNPSVGGAGVTFLSENTSSTGVFTLPATGLTAGASYSYKAYALNTGSQEAYSAVDTFSTISASGTIHPLNDGNPRSDLGTGGASQAVRGWRFKANTAVSVTELGSDNPLGSGQAFNVVLWDVASQTQLAKVDFTSNGLDAWQWQSLTTPVPLTSGKEYIVCLYSTAVGYYFGQAGGNPAWFPTGDIQYLDMRYANSATADTFPTDVLGGYQYGVADIGYSKRTMGVSGKSIAIASGDTTPDTTDDTDYGNVVANVGTVTHTFTISSKGAEDIHLTGATPVTVSGSSDFSVTVQPSSPVTAPSGTTTFEVKFTPTSVGPKTATVSIASDDAAHPIYTFDIKGTGLGLPKLQVSDNGGKTYVPSETPESLGGVRVNTTGSQRGFVLTNSGNAVLNVGALTIDGMNPSEFAVSGLSNLSTTNVGGAHVMGSTVSTVVNPGETFGFTVTFSPSAVGPRSAKLHIPSDDPDVSDFVLNLSGTGQAPAIQVGDDDAEQFRANNATEDMGSVVFGKSGSPRHMRIFNSKGSASLTVNTMTIDGTNSTDFVLSPLVLDNRAGSSVSPGAVVKTPTGFVINAGLEATFTITFTPSALGTRTAVLHIPSNDLTTPAYVINLTGVGQQLDPPTVGFPKTQPVLNKRTGLYEWLLQVTNPNANAITGFDLFISDLPSTVTVWNAATDFKEPKDLSGTPYAKVDLKPKTPVYRLHYGAPLSAGASTTVVVLFSSKTRPMPKLTPSIRLQIVESDVPSKGLYGVPVLKVTKVPGKGNLVEFASTVGGSYRMWYTANVRSTALVPVPTGPWYSVPSLIKGTGTKTLWMDQGPPATISSPLEDPRREYRVELVLPYRPLSR